MATRQVKDNFRIVPLDGTYAAIQLFIGNPTILDYTFTLFSGYSLVPVINFINPILPYIVGSTGYNFFIQGLSNSPLMVRQIMLVTQNVEQLNQPLYLVTKDANGIECDNPRLPNISVSVNQYQPLISYVNFRKMELLLNDNTTVKYTVKANSTVTMVIYYKQVPKISIFTDKLGVCDMVDLHKHVPNNRTERQLLFQSHQMVFNEGTLYTR